ncbi:hypothetical protein AAVH_27252 [Aphelenchoides avenae]|nr:hypothetical protein AAVH_27252 [Aphelenchus avenae]
MDFVDEAGEHRYLNGTKAHLCCPVGGGCYFSSSDNGPSTSLCLEGMWTREFRQCPQTEENETEVHAKRRLSTSIAERVERFYDNANSPEKTFLQRVVAQLHDHFEKSKQV